MVTTFSMKIDNDKGGKKLLSIIRGLNKEKIRNIVTLMVDVDDEELDEALNELIPKYDVVPTEDLTCYVIGAWVNQDASGGGTYRTIKEAVRIAICALVMQERSGFQDLVINVH